jgi:hypothetical protein
MPRRTDAELGRLVRQALKGHRLKPRRLDLPTVGMCYGLPRPEPGLELEESDNDFLGNNVDAAVALLEALSPPNRRKHDQSLSI